MLWIKNKTSVQCAIVIKENRWLAEDAESSEMMTPTHYHI